VLDQPLRLCGRADGDPSRSYEGALSQLALFDRALGPLDVLALYTKVAERSSSSGGSGGPAQAAGAQARLRDTAWGQRGCHSSSPAAGLLRHPPPCPAAAASPACSTVPFCSRQAAAACQARRPRPTCTY
jgi:hypothetical protein